DLLGHFCDAVEHRGAAREDRTRGQEVHIATLVNDVPHGVEDLFDAGLDDLGQHAAWQHTGTTATHGGHLDGLFVVDHGGHGAAVLDLDALGFGHRCAQTRGNVVGQVDAADRDHA